MWHGRQSAEKEASRCNGSTGSETSNNTTFIRTAYKEATFSDDFFGFTIPCFPGGSGTVSAQACQIKSRRLSSFECQIKHKSWNMRIMKCLTILCPYLWSVQSKLQSHSCQHSPPSLQSPRRQGFEEALSYYWAGTGGGGRCSRVIFYGPVLRVISL